MTTLDAGAAPADTQRTSMDEAQPKPGRVKETNFNGKTDPFAVAFNAAKDEIEGVEAKPKPKAKPEAEKPATKLKREAKKTAAPNDEDEAKPQDRTYAKDSDGEADADAEKPAPKAKAETREPPKYWSEKRKDAFRYQPREVQDEWLEAEPEANDRWPTDIKEAFATLPREAKELVLAQLNEADKGLNQKFQALAAERKLAEDIRAAVPAHMRSYMQQRGLNEPQVFGKLLALQHQSMVDPVGYARQFIVANKIDPLDIFDGQAAPQGQASQADVSSHPAYQALRAEYETLRQSIASDRAQREEEENRRFMADFEGVVSETDGEGNSLYPYIRLLSEPMARIIDANPELFDDGSMGTKERFSTAYRMALQEFPELQTPRRTARTSPADEQEEETAHADPGDKRAEKLDRAITPKSKTPATVPAKTKAADPLDAAIESARKQLKR